MPEGLTYIDLIAAVAIGFGAIRGLTNGIIKEVAGLIGVVLGIWAGFRFAFLFADYYRENFEIPDNLIPFLAFLSTFIVVLVAILILGKILKGILKKAQLGFTDKAAGAAFGALKWGFIVGSLVSLVGKAGFIPDETKESSVAYPILTTYCEVVTEYSVGLIPAAKNVFADMDEYFDDLAILRGDEPHEEHPLDGPGN